VLSAAGGWDALRQQAPAQAFHMIQVGSVSLVIPDLCIFDLFVFCVARDHIRILQLTLFIQSGESNWPFMGVRRTTELQPQTSCILKFF
jgi:hypothetical protein